LVQGIERGESFKELLGSLKKGELSQDEETWDALKERVAFVTFHQSFGYEDLIEGFRPNEEGKIKLVDGILKRLAKQADEDRDRNYYLIIDEINRGNISKIFGELITLIEEDKRDMLEVTLPYSKKRFSVPSNLYIIGTMNTADKSIALIDVALRRRFTFVKMEPNAELIHDEKARNLFERLNALLAERLGKEKEIGHSYFMGNDLDLDFVIDYRIRPLMEEYFYGDPDGLEVVEALIEGRMGQSLEYSEEF
jgi:5-methylcytosine-specific restriction endonuclease McrBC GTP-binding regulatory subunit McrB